MRTLIKEYQKLLNRLHVVIDAVVIVFSYIASWYLRFKSGIFELDPWFLSLQEYAKVLIIIVPGIWSYIMDSSYIHQNVCRDADWKHGISFRQMDIGLWLYFTVICVEAA